MITQLVADYRADIMVAREVDDATPLIIAAKHQQYDATRALLRALHLLPPRLAVEHLAAEDKSESTARAWAVLKGNRRIVDAIDEAERETLRRKVHLAALYLTTAIPHPRHLCHPTAPPPHRLAPHRSPHRPTH